jgi:hypothetical protein
MHTHAPTLGLAILLAVPGSASAADSSGATAKAVRAFTQHVAEEVTHRGPAAWRDQFAESPDFFMASEGHLVFESSAALDRGLVDLTKSIAKIDLTFAKDVRVDVLTPGLAMVGATYHEIRVDKAGASITESGYFTALAEKGAAGWRFRNAHWSVAAPPAAVP